MNQTTTYTTLTTVLLLATAILAPGAAAHHVRTYEYDVPGHPNSALGIGISTRPCANEWREWEGGVIGGGDDPTDPAAGEALTLATETACEPLDPEGDGAVRIGMFGQTLDEGGNPPGEYFVNVQDDNFDSTYIKVVFYDESGQAVADVAGCGSVGFVLPHSAAFMVYVYATHIDLDTAETCLGTSGRLVITHSG